MGKYEIEYYATVGQHGSVGRYDAFDEAKQKALIFLKRERKEGNLDNGDLQYIGIDSNDKFAVLFITPSYISDMRPYAFSDKGSYDIFMKAAEKCLETGKPQVGKYRISKQAVIDYLISKGNNPGEAETMVLNNYEYTTRTYPQATVAKLAEIIRSINENVGEHNLVADTKSDSMANDQDLMSIRSNGELLGYIEMVDGKITTSGIIGENTYDNFVDLIRGLQGFNIKIDDFLF